MIGIAPTKVLFVIFLWERFFVPTRLSMSENPIDINRYRAEKIAAVKTAVQESIAQFLRNRGMTTVLIEWDETSSYQRLRCFLRDITTNEPLLIGNQFHRDVINALTYSTDPRLADYELNPYGEAHYITFDKI